MRSPILIMLTIAVMIAGAVMIPGSDASSPARLYFFDDTNECIAEVILLPGEPLNSGDIPWHGDNKDWYDEDAVRVYPGRAFDAGDHIIKAYDTSSPPVKPSEPESIDLTPMTIAVAGILLASLIAVIVLHLKKK